MLSNINNIPRSLMYVIKSGGEVMIDTEIAKEVIKVKENLQKQVKELEQACAEFNDFYNNSPCGFHSLDKDGVFIRINDTELRMLGYSHDEIIGKKKLNDVLTANSSKIFQNNFPKFKERGYTKNVEYEMVRKDGTVMPVILNTIVVKDVKGNYIRSRAVVIDITDRKKAQQLLKDTANRKMDFVATVSHEFKNPLGIIKEALSQVMEGFTGAINIEQKNTLETAKRNIERLIRLTTDLLDIAKIEAGMMELKREKIEMGILIDEIVADNKAEISKKQLVVKKDIPQNIGLLWADKDKVTEVIVNLLDNAIKYTPSGGRIAIKILGTDNEIRFEISDTGSGIAKEDIDKLFNKFKCISAQRKEGTGLGLFIAKDIIELHKGNIWAESEVEHGSKFIFILPRDFKKLQK